MTVQAMWPFIQKNSVVSLGQWKTTKSKVRRQARRRSNPAQPVREVVVSGPGLLGQLFVAAGTR